MKHIIIESEKALGLNVEDSITIADNEGQRKYGVLKKTEEFSHDAPNRVIFKYNMEEIKR